MSKRAAFLDFDKTLVDCDAGVLFGRALLSYRLQEIRRQPLRRRLAGYLRVAGAVAWLMGQEAAWRLLYVLRIIKRSTLVRRAYRFLEGLPAEETYRRMEEVFHEKIAERFYPQMLRIVERHRRQGDEVVIVSTGMEPLVEHARKYLGEVEIIACRLVEQAGELTGAVDGPLYGAHKRDLVERWAKDHDVDLSESAAYTDHYSDAPLLEAVGHPVAVNPNRRLRRLARRRGWAVVDLPGAEPEALPRARDSARW